MMYPSLNNNGSSLINTYYNDNIYSNIPQEVYHTPSSSSFLHPSPIYIPLEDEAVFCDIFQQQQFFSNDHNHNILAHEMSDFVDSAMGECNNNYGNISKNNGDNDHCDFITHVKPDNYDSPRKIPANKDRHSKINTARGLRDRRMRLSLDVAKRFFKLQDILGFDKASKTVDWLLTKSKSAVLDLIADHSTSSTTECDDVSGTGDQFIVKTGSRKKQKKKVSRVKKCGAFQNPLTKETRVRARQRARERTTEKHNTCKHEIVQDSTFKTYLDQVMDQDENQLGSWCRSSHQQNQMSSNFPFTKGFVGDNSSWLMTGNHTTSYYLDDHSSGLTDEHHVNDLYINGKAWEGGNN